MSGIEFDPKCLINDHVVIPYFMSKGTTGHYGGRLESGVTWSDYTIQYFSKANIWEIIDQVLENRKPVFFGIFGPTGNGKSSVIVNILEYLYAKHSPLVDFRLETLHHFYWMGHSVTLDPIIVSLYFRQELGIPENQNIFLVIDEAEFVIPSDRSTATQNHDARKALDTLRANNIHIIFVAIKAKELDHKIVYGKLVFRLDVLFNNIPLQKIKYNVLVWAEGYYFKNKEYTEREGYVLFAENQFMPWSRTDYYNRTHELKQGKIYGGDITAFLSSNDNKDFLMEGFLESSEDDIIDEIVRDFESNYPDLPFDRVNRVNSIEFVVNELLIPIINKFDELRMKIGNTRLQSIIETTQGLPTHGVDWRPHIRRAKLLARSTSEDD